MDIDMKSRKQRLRSAELRQLNFIGQQLQRIANNLERGRRMSIVAGDDAQIALGNIEEIGTNYGEVTEGNNSPLLDKSTIQTIGGNGNNYNRSSGNHALVSSENESYEIGSGIGKQQSGESDFVTTYGKDSPGKIVSNTQFNNQANQAIGNVEGGVIYDKGCAENSAAPQSRRNN